MEDCAKTITTKYKSKKKLVSFKYEKEDLQKLNQYLRNGWIIINLMRKGKIYNAILEQYSKENFNKAINDGVIFMSPSKKIRLKKNSIF